MVPSALSDVRVLELAEMVSGPYCGKLLSGLGAEVIKVERPGGGDGARGREPFYGDTPGNEKSGLFLYLNTGKRGITLDITTSTGAKLFRRLVEDADILIDSHRPGELEWLGLGYEALSKVNSRLIMISITPFGQTGPYRDYRAYDLNLWHTGGIGYLTRTATSGDRFVQPLKSPGYHASLLAGMHATVAVLSALEGREIIGEGQHIDLSQQESLVSMLHYSLAPYIWEGRILGSPGQPEFTGWFVPCKDGEIYLRWVEEVHFQRLLDVLDRPAWSEEDWCQDPQQRMASFDLLKALIADWAKDYTKEEIYRKGQALRVPFAMPRSMPDLLEDRQFAEREFFVEIDHPETGRVTHPGSPFKFSETPWRFTHAAPRLGEHNEEVFCQRLGLEKSELIKMGEAGVV